MTEADLLRFADQFAHSLFSPKQPSRKTAESEGLWLKIQPQNNRPDFPLTSATI